MKKKPPTPNILDLGGRFVRAARNHGGKFVQDLKEEIRSGKPEFDRLYQSAREHGSIFRDEMEEEFLRWVERERRKGLFQAGGMLGREPGIERHYALLGLPYGTDAETVKHAWRELIKKYHPDRFADDPWKQQRATEMTQQLTTAYHEIIRALEQGRV